MLYERLGDLIADGEVAASKTSAGPGKPCSRLLHAASRARPEYADQLLSSQAPLPRATFAAGAPSQPAAPWLFPRTGLSDDPDALPRIDAEREIRNGLHLSRRGREAEIMNLELSGAASALMRIQCNPQSVAEKLKHTSSRTRKPAVLPAASRGRIRSRARRD